MIKIRLLAFLRNLILTNDLQNVFILVQFYNSNNMSLKVSQMKLIYISSRHKQLYMTNDETPNNLSDSKLIPTSVENLLGVTIINSLCWDNHINQVLKNVILIYSCCQELIYFWRGKKTYFTKPIFFPFLTILYNLGQLHFISRRWNC